MLAQNCLKSDEKTEGQSLCGISLNKCFTALLLKCFIALSSRNTLHKFPTCASSGDGMNFNEFHILQ